MGRDYTPTEDRPRCRSATPRKSRIIEPKYSGESGTSDLATTISITSLKSSGALSFHLFDYADFDLNGSASDDSVEFPSSNLVRQTKGSAWCVETAFTPTASHVEANLDGQTLASLNDGLSTPTTLNDNPTSGPGNATWALQWISASTPVVPCSSARTS